MRVQSAFLSPSRSSGTGKEQQITIRSSGGLSKEEMERMAKDAEAHADADKKRRETIEVRNEADAAVHNTKKNLDEHKANLPQEVQDDVQTKIVELEQLLSEDEVEAEAVRKAVDELQQSAMKMGEAIYKSSGVRTQRACNSTARAPSILFQLLRLPRCVRELTF
eukprot:COSAG02_NODE_171_length_31397_cov_27.217554_11_plen_165_part_00